MNNTGFLVALAAIAVLLAVAFLSKYIAHFNIGDRIAEKRAAYKIENAKADIAFNDPLLRSLISCPGCGTAGDFEVVGAKQCTCNKCGTVWDAA